MLQMVAYWEPKEGTSTSEWEDGAAFSAQTGWFAIADGASTANSSREWAYLLTDSFVHDQPTAALEVEDGAGRRAFLEWVRAARTRFDPHSPEFPPSRMPSWVQSAGERLGAHATFLGGRINDGEIKAVAVGDCCLFHAMTEQARPRSFPLTDPGQFGTAPALVSSLEAGDGRLAESVRHYRAPMARGNVVFAASDALAEWLSRGADRPELWHALARIGHEGFSELCQDLRANREMKNDDVTLWRASLARSPGVAV
ncbi:MAG: hypothetical protein QOK10_88 [Pseudonocardiales bacterium]|jgi:hypothetical protein|nr:hypothetical protein [Pseudonocardiales bacterium]